MAVAFLFLLGANFPHDQLFAVKFFKISLGISGWHIKRNEYFYECNLEHILVLSQHNTFYSFSQGKVPQSSWVPYITAPLIGRKVDCIVDIVI